MRNSAVGKGDKVQSKTDPTRGVGTAQNSGTYVEVRWAFGDVVSWQPVADVVLVFKRK